MLMLLRSKPYLEDLMPTFEQIKSSLESAWRAFPRKWKLVFKFLGALFILSVFLGFLLNLSAIVLMGAVAWSFLAGS